MKLIWIWKIGEKIVIIALSLIIVTLQRVQKNVKNFLTKKLLRVIETILQRKKSYKL